VGITISRTNFPGPITFTVTGAPAGADVIINNPATTNNFSITFGNPPAVQAGSYPVTITASAPGAPNVTQPLTINFGG
jgi:hypothetical protein